VPYQQLDKKWTLIDHRICEFELMHRISCCLLSNLHLPALVLKRSFLLVNSPSLRIADNLNNVAKVKIFKEAAWSDILFLHSVEVPSPSVPLSRFVRAQ